MAVICVGLLTVKLLALLAPNFTAPAPVRLVPVMTTLVPPAVEPVEGEILPTVGIGAALIVRLMLIVLE